jgi:hypothetical protein
MTAVGPGGEDLTAFAVGLRRRRVRAAARDAALRVVLGLAVPALALAWALPAWRLPLAGAIAVGAAASAWLAARRARRVADAALLAVGDDVAGDALPGASPQLLAEVGDELATWLERSAKPASAMTAWLAADVRRKLPALPPRAVASVGRRRLGGVLWMLPLALVLVLAWWIADLLAPPWAGVLGGNGGAGSSAGGSGGAGGGAGGRSDGAPDPARAQPPDEPQQGEARNDAPPPPPAAPNDQPPPPETPTPQEPAPLLDLPEQQRFVVPDFLGDGPTRRARVRAAEVEQGAPTAAAPRAASPEELSQQLPPPRPETFARAAEQAQAARHVPPAERAMVKRYFTRLQQAGK